MSNTFNALITMVVTTTRMVGMMMGTMIFQKVVHSVAPSTWAASRISSGTALSEAERMVMQKPVHIQTPTTMSAAVLMPGIVIQDTGGNPRRVMIEFSRPIWT